jgi:hypothetical protein
MNDIPLCEFFSSLLESSVALGESDHGQEIRGWRWSGYCGDSRLIEKRGGRGRCLTGWICASDIPPFFDKDGISD